MICWAATEGVDGGLVEVWLGEPDFAARRRNGAVKVEAPSAFDAYQLNGRAGAPLNIEMLFAVISEVVMALRQADLEPVASAIERYLSAVPKAPEALEKVFAEIRPRMTRAFLTLKAHKRAKELLGDEWWWDPTDATSPHGSDIGADVLIEFASFRAHRPRGGARQFLRELLADADDLTSDDATIAAAFAMLKHDGQIERPLAEAARSAIDRQRSPAALERWPAREARLEGLARMDDLLARLLAS